MKFIQHIPGFVSGFEPYKIEFKDTKDLLHYPKINRSFNDPDFHQFSVNQYWNSKDWILFSEYHKDQWKDFKQGGWHLILEYKGPRRWWVVGTSNEPLDLPKFQSE